MKPRLRRWYGKWECFGHGGSVSRETPKEAYMAWGELFMNALHRQHDIQLAKLMAWEQKQGNLNILPYGWEQ